jgi:hypothetical protein
MSTETKTDVQQSQIAPEELDNLLGMPGAESVMTAQEETEETKPNFFSSEKVDVSFVDNNSEESDDSGASESEGNDASPSEANEGGEFDNIVSEVEPINDDDIEPSSNAGRPRLDKSGMAQLAQTLIEENMILPFDEDKQMEDYTLDDFKELFKVNFEEKERQIREQTPAEFFQSLPPELQYAAKYVADGGQDLKSLFSHLARAEETRSLDPTSERGQESIVREYLQATNFGTAEDIQEEIETWKDLDKLEEKALKFKPKLDAMEAQILQRQLAEQEQRKRQKEEASHRYMESVYTTLDSGEINGIKLNPKVQNMLYSGLIQPNYPSISGQNTNLFGHLIEKYQFVEPRHDLIAEALWLLADPDGYRAQISANSKAETTKEVVRHLKTEEQSKGSSTGSQVQDAGGNRKPRGLARPTKDFFKR